MATKRRFDIGDQVALRGIVRLLDVGGPGTVTIEIAGTGQRMTVMADSTHVELVAKGKQGRASPRRRKAGRDGSSLIADRNCYLQRIGCQGKPSGASG